MENKDCIFCKIGKGEITARKEYEDEGMVAFHDISPKAPVHILIIPKQHIEQFADLDDFGVWVKIAEVAKQLIDRLGLRQKGYRLVSNGSKAALVPHLHVHLMGDVTTERAV